MRLEHAAPITEDFLNSIGFDLDKATGEWTLVSRNFVFGIRRDSDSKAWWTFWVGNDPEGQVLHCVDHLDELFGCIAEDMERARGEGKLLELREFLGASK